MYLRLVIAGSLGLLWYFSDCGRALAQLFIFVLCCISTPLLCAKGGRESSTQTDEETLKHPLLETDEEESSDLIDGEAPALSDPLKPCCPDVKRSLQEVFECAYAQLVLPWYEVPEPCEQQPLHQVLSREMDFVIDRIIERAIDFDACQAVVGSIRIFTQHLHNAKQPDRELLFSSRAEELTVLREISDALVRNLFSKSLLGPEVNCCALNEIIALKGLGLLINWLSDPDNLNQLVVNQLDSVSLKNSAEELHVSDPDEPSLDSRGVEGCEVSLSGEAASSDCEIKEKTKVNRLKVGWSKFVDKVKSKKAKKKKMKRLEQDLVMRLMAVQTEGTNEDVGSSRESCVVDQEDSDREDSDLEDYLASVQEDLIEFKLSYEMWRVGHWTVSIPHAVWEEEEKALTFTVHLEEKDSPENLQWDIKKTYMDVVHFCNRWQDCTNISEIAELGECEVSSKIKEEVRASVERFLQELISDNVIGHSQPVFQFLCPLDKLLNEEVQSGGVWGLLSGLAYLLTPGHEEEESSGLQTEVPKENPVSSSLKTESTALSLENDCNSAQNGSVGSPLPSIVVSPLPSIVVSQYDSPQVPVEAKGDRDPPPAVESHGSHDSSPHDKPEDSDITFTTHLKTIMKGLTRSRSQDSLTSTKSAGNDEMSDTASQQEGPATPSLLSSSARSNKRERFRMAVVGNKAKGKEAQNPPVKGEDSQCQKCQTSWEQLEATKAIFDLLKEISGNSILINFFDAFLKPVMPILKKKINSFLDKIIPTEENMAGYIDILKNKQWPKCPAEAALPPRTKEDKDETRSRAHNLINAKYSSFIVLKKTDVETVFNLFQDSEENKMLIYRLISFLLRGFLQDEEFLNGTSAALQKLSTSTN